MSTVAARSTRLVRLVLAFLLATATVLTSAFIGTGAAYAASGDVIQSYDIDYVVQSSGTVQVKETIDYRFAGSGRHGIYRNFVTREKYDDKQDAVYGIDNIQVSSPDGVSTQTSSSTDSSQGGREQELKLQIGSENQTISQPSATYVITYDVTGAMRNTPASVNTAAYDEFYWDATGLGWDASIAKVNITVTAPGGVKDTTCTWGGSQSTTKCAEQRVEDGVAKFGQTGLGDNEGVTIGNKITAGLIADSSPNLQPDASAPAKLHALVGGIGAGLVAILSPILGVLYWRKNGRDQRYAGMAPGTTPMPGDPVEVVLNDPKIPIPVAFSPPKIPVGEAGLLVDGQFDTRDTAATIIDLAVRGALTVQSESDKDFRVTLVDPSKTSAPHEMVLLNSVFGGRPPGTTEDLSAPGSMLDAHKAVQRAVIDQVQARGWFTKIPAVRTARNTGAGLIAFAVFGAFIFGKFVLVALIGLLPLLITVLVVRRKMGRGQRTPDGRAVCDQVEGFRTYLATAEADQLRFEEGEDIFSRYLPWAIAFDLAERWAKVCADLVRLGRIPDTTPYWYYGSYHMGAFNTGFLTGTLVGAASPVPSSSSGGGTGFGGGSSFSGGGFSGGGGGGGGGGSW